MCCARPSGCRSVAGLEAFALGPSAGQLEEFNLFFRRERCFLSVQQLAGRSIHSWRPLLIEQSEEHRYRLCRCYAASLSVKFFVAAHLVPLTLRDFETVSARLLLRTFLRAGAA